MTPVIFFDIDGTLALGGEIVPSAREAIGEFRKGGGLALICSGRPRAYAEATFGDMVDGFVCNNGRLAVCGGRRLVDRVLSPDQVASFVETLDAQGAGYAFFGERDAWYGGSAAFRHIADEVYAPRTFMELAGTAIHAYNFDIYFSDAAHRERIAAALGDACIVNPHGPHPSADITAAGFGKGDAVREVASALGVPLRDTYAFGDGINDISMLEAAGTGVAMGNAAPELKAVAQYVTSDILDDGVARGLKHLGLV